jgi:hypothetical protein
MRKFIVLAVVAAVGLLLVSEAQVAQAQYYGYYYIPPQQPQQAPMSAYQRGPTPINPRLRFMVPNPRLFQQWNLENRMSDYDQLIRSPLNPESSLDYMLRTF